jgi:tryprostatin B 6-hydroxylase
MVFFISILSFVSGVLLHLLVFSRNEWDRHAPRVFLTFWLAASSIFVSLTLGWRYRLGEALGATSVLGSSHLAGLFTSMIIYRVFFHPLKSFSGPIGARVTAFWITKQNIPDMTFYRTLPKLHDQYGDFVRIRELLSVFVCASTFTDQDI